MPIDRLQLLDWLLPHCEPGTASILYPKGSTAGPGWVQTPADVERAVAAYRNGTLPAERFASVTKNGKRYTIANGTRLGLVPHRDGVVARFCLDFDDHDQDGGNVHLVAAVDRFLGAEAISFTSKGGKGVHCLYALAQPMPVEQFVEWAKAWGFNRRADIECFPKTAKRTQVWLPNEPNEDGGDAYRAGSFESCLIQELPPAPSRRLNKDSLDFLRGFVAPGFRNESLNRAAYHCAKQRMPQGEAGKLCARGARLCGLMDEEPDQSKATFASGYHSGAEEVRTRQPKVTDDRTAGPETLRGLGCTDYGNAQRLVRRHGQDLRHCYDFNQWLTWTGSHWSFEPAIAEQKAKDTVLSIYEEVGKLAKAEDRESLHRHAIRSEQASRITAMLALARSEPGVAVRPEELDRNIWLLNCRNGTLDLHTGQLHPHRREDLITRCLQIQFDAQAQCPKWCSFLHRIMNGNKDVIQFVQRAVGYTLTGSTSERCMFILHTVSPPTSKEAGR